ncbi:MAG: hypothetical protein ACRCWS_03325 [Propionibacteriaceae bacterium]
MSQPPYFTTPQQQDQPQPVDPAPPVSIESFRPPRKVSPAILGLIGAITAGSVALAAVMLTPPKPTPLAATPPIRTTTTTPPALSPTTQATQDRHTFDSPDGARGTWEITEVRWDGSHVSVYVRITVESGNLYCDLRAASNSKGDYRKPALKTLSPKLELNLIPAGSTSEGWISFDLPEHATAILLLSDGTKPAGALEIES